jgi:hypothetical protein
MGARIGEENVPRGRCDRDFDSRRKLDRDPNVVRMTPQPFRLSWDNTDEPVSHVPDLLTQHTDGVVTVWDVRSLEQQDDDFRAKSFVTRRACERVGWRPVECGSARSRQRGQREQASSARPYG